MVEFKFTRRDGYACVALAFITLAVYGRMTDASWVGYDDNRYVTENAHVQSGVHWSTVKWAFTTGYADNWHPLTWISHIVDCQLFGLNAARHHETSVLFHIANTILLFSLLRRLTGAFWRCLIAAALFAWHPLHVESVAWVAERKDVLSAFFWLLTLLAYTAYARCPGTGRYLLTLVLFVLALLAKPMVVTLPFVLLLLDFWPLNRIAKPSLRAEDSPSPQPGAATQLPLSRLIWEKLPFFALSAVCSYLTYAVQSAGGTTRALNASLETRFANALISYCRYAAKIFWPANLAVFYPYDLSPPAWQTLGAALLLAGVTLAAVWWRRTRPWFLFGWLFFLGTLVPVIGIVQVGDQSIADRYSYLPALGIFIAVVWSAAGLWAALPSAKTPFTLAMAGILASLLAVTWVQESYWHDGKTLFRHALDVTRDNAVAEYNYASDLFLDKDYPEAMTHYLETVRINPRHYLAWDGAGSCLLAQGRSAEAAGYFERVVKLRPGYWEAHLKHGLTLETTGDLAGAVTEYSEAARLQPDNSKPHILLGTLLLSQNHFAEAKAELTAATHLQPDMPVTHSKLAMALTALGENAEAAGEYESLLQKNPNDLTSLNNLAWLRAANADAQLRNGPEAVQLAQRACDLTANAQPYVLGTLAAAYAEAGQFPEAIAAAQKARELALNGGLNEVAAKNDELLKLFQAGQPFHESPNKTASH